MRLDLPTLERPANAISMRSAGGRNSSAGTLFKSCQRPLEQLLTGGEQDLVELAHVRCLRVAGALTCACPCPRLRVAA